MLFLALRDADVWKAEEERLVQLSKEPLRLNNAQYEYLIYRLEQSGRCWVPETQWCVN